MLDMVVSAVVGVVVVAIVVYVVVVGAQNELPTAGNEHRHGLVFVPGSIDQVVFTSRNSLSVKGSTDANIQTFGFTLTKFVNTVG